MPDTNPNPPDPSDSVLKPAPVEPLLEQMRKEFLRTVDVDLRLGNLIRRQQDATFSLNTANSNVRQRLAFLRKMAVQKIARKNRIRYVPGFNNTSESIRYVRDMKNKLKEITMRHEFEIPEELQDGFDSPTNSSETHP